MEHQPYIEPKPFRPSKAAAALLRYAKRYIKDWYGSPKLTNPYWLEKSMYIILRCGKLPIEFKRGLALSSDPRKLTTMLVNYNGTPIKPDQLWNAPKPQKQLKDYDNQGIH